jgi:hypothetical protein
VGTGGKSCATRPDFSHDLVVHPPDGGGSHQAVASAGICGRCPAFPKRYVESVEPQRVPVAPGAQGQTPKKVPETDAIFANIRERDRDSQDEAVMRLSMDCKATVKIGDYSRGGKTRGDHRAADHDMGCEEKHTPFGVVNEDSGSLHLSFGSSGKRSAPPPLEAQDHAGLLSGLRGNNSSMRLFGQEGSFSRVLVSQAMGSMSFMRAVSSRD